MFLFRRIGVDIVFQLRVRVRRARRPIVLPLYIECYFGWFIDETLSSLLARYRFFLPFFMSSLPNASRATLSITSGVYPRCAAFTSPPLALSLHPSLTLSSLRVTSPCHFLSSPRTGPAGCTFRHSADFKKVRKGRQKLPLSLSLSLKEENDSDRTEGSDKFAKRKRRKAVWSINDLFRFICFADSTVPVGLCLLIEKGLSVVSEFFFQIFWYTYV